MTLPFEADDNVVIGFVADAAAPVPGSLLRILMTAS